MSRLKGADLGIVIPTSAKATTGAALPPFAGRLPGDIHYAPPSTALPYGQLYVLQGSVGTTYTDSFDSKANGTNLVGATTEVGGKTWSAPNLGFTVRTPTIQNGMTQNDAAGGTQQGAAITGLPTTGRTVSVDMVVDSGWLAEGDIFGGYLDVGDTAGYGDGPLMFRMWPFYAGWQIWLFVDGTPVINQLTLAAISSQIDTTKSRHTFTIEAHTDKTAVAAIDGITVWSGSFTGTLGPNDAIRLDSTATSPHHHFDNFSDAAQGSLAWTPVLPSTLMNWKGNWSATPASAYAPNDVVLRNGQLFVAAATPGAVDPANLVTANLGGQTSHTSSTGQRSAQPFQVLSSVQVSQIKIMADGSSTAYTGGKTAGIASAITGGTATYLASGTTHATATGAYDTIPLNTTVTLNPGTTYYLVCEESGTGGDNGTTHVNAGVVTTSAGLFYGAAFSSSIVNRLTFEIDGVSTTWTALTPPTRPIHGTTTNYTMTASDSIVVATAAVTVTLPGASATTKGIPYTVKNLSGGTVAVASGGGNIDGLTGDSLTVQGDAHTYINDGTNWFITSH